MLLFPQVQYSIMFVCSNSMKASMVALQGVANRDVKLENTLLVSSARPLIKLFEKRPVLRNLLEKIRVILQIDIYEIK